MAQNLVEKITQRFASGFDKEHEVNSGDYIYIKPAYVMTHDNTGAVIPKFESIGAAKFAIPRQVVFTLDHNIQDKSEKNIAKYKRIEEFSKSMGNDFYPAGRGIGHQIMVEEGYAFPGSMVVASDSHSNMYGGLGVLGTPVVRTDAAAIWATGKTWWKVPNVVKVVLNGNLKQGVTGKDVIIALCGKFNNDEVLNHIVEFTGEGISNLSIEQRLTIANMTTEWGALGGLFPIDDVTISWLEKRKAYLNKRGLPGVPSDEESRAGSNPRINDRSVNWLKENISELTADTDAHYAKEISLELESVEPHVSGPDSVKVINSVSELDSQHIIINKAYLVSCVNSRLEDIAEAAEILKGKKVAEGVKFYVAAASSEIQAESESLGYWQSLLDAGAIPLPPGCGPCIGLGAGLLKEGEVGISATNRNFKGRMGSSAAKTYLASPSVVAASVVAGKITYDWKGSAKLEGSLKINPLPELKKTDVKIIENFPCSITGELIWCYKDNLNTDGIYPGKYTYVDDITPEDQAKVVMENYDPDFVGIVNKGDILIAGFNFGTGSSREQAATALKYCGIQLVIAGSVSATFSRNALNNGFLVIELPELVKDIKAKFGTDKLTVKTGISVTINFNNSTVILEDKRYFFIPFGIPAQELVTQGGLENWVKSKLYSD